MNVIAYAYVARPNSQSVTLAAYQTMLSVARVTNLCVIAHANDRKHLEDSELASHADIAYAGSSLLTKVLRGTAHRLFGEAWHIINMICLIDVWIFELHVLLKLLLCSRYRHGDILHRVGPRTLRTPSVICRWVDMPVVTGVHLCGMTWPKGFEYLSAQEHSMDKVRELDRLVHYMFGDYEKMSAIMVHNKNTATVVPNRYRNKCRVVSGIGIEGEMPLLSKHAGDVRRLLFVGRLVPFKCCRIAVEAMISIPEDVTLTIVGDGPEKGDIEREIDRLGLANRVFLVGKVPRGDIWKYYSEAGVFVFPSVRESGGAVILEAMSVGLPCIVADWGGPSEFIDQSCGIRIPVWGRGPDVLRRGLVDGILELYGNERVGREMSVAARRRIEGKFLWKKIGKSIVDVYTDVTCQGRRQ